MVRLRCDFAEVIELFLLKSLDAQSAPGMTYFLFKVRKCPILKVLNLKKEIFNGLALSCFTCVIRRPKFEKE